MDPYGAEQMTVGQTIADYATSPIKPSTYMSMYATWPGMWSTGKGLWIPGIGKSLEARGAMGTASRAMRMTKAAFRRKGILGGTAAIGKETFKRVTSFGTRGGGYLGESFLTQGKLAGQLYDDVYQQTLKAYSGFKGFGQEAVETAAKSTANRALMRGSLTRGSVNITGLGQSINIPGKFTALKTAGNLGKKRLLTPALKMGLGAGKVVSMVGAAMFAWDMIKMVGEPLGRAAIRTLDNTLTEYNNRFMPETGGRLELSYLSQGAATERQRALEQISKSSLNARYALGQEAAYAHQ